MAKIYCPICECETDGTVSVINRAGKRVELYHCEACSEVFWRTLDQEGGDMTEVKAEYVTETVTKEDNHKNTPWLCKSCGTALGYVHFDRTRLVMHCADLCVTIYGYAIITCHKCGGEQEWVASGEHKLMRRIAKHGVDL